jgi:outer membrane protein insertion porin family
MRLRSQRRAVAGPDARFGADRTLRDGRRRISVRASAWIALALLAASLPLTGVGRAQSAPGTPVRVAVLPFRVHAPSDQGEMSDTFARQLAARLEADERLEVLGPDEVREALRPGEVADELSEARLRELARELGAVAVVAGSVTELAGRFSLDLRITPAAAGARSTTLVDTAPSRPVLAQRLGEMATRVVARVAGEGAPTISSIEIVGAGEVEERLRSDIESRVGQAYDPDRANRDADRMERDRSIASVSVETERTDDGVILRFRAVRSEMIFGEAALGGEGERVVEVRVTGNRRIESDAIVSRIRTKPGDVLRPSQVSADVREVFGLGFFRNVRVLSDATPEGVVLTFEVEENPVVRQIAVTGNDNVDGDTIRDALTLTTGSTLDLPLLYENTQRIQALYKAQGYYLAQVGYEIQPLASEGSVAIEFQIDEKEKLRLTQIDFTGNEQFDDAELSEDFNTKRWRWWSYATSWFDKSGTYSEPIFLRDLRQVEKKYTDDGYLQVEVGEPAVEASEKGIVVTVPITEGPQFDVGTIDVAGDDTVDLDRLRKKLKLEEGEVFNRSHLTEDVERLESHYTDRGFYFANVQPATKLDVENRTVDVQFRVEKGPLYFVRHVEIAGNDRTVDEVIRREMRAVEGQLYSARAINVSTRRIRGVGYFEDVAFEPRQTEDPSQLDLDLNVVERPTGAFSFGAGFSTQDSFIFTASLSEQNLFGRGYNVSLSADLGQTSSSYYFSVSDPYFLGSDFSLSATVFLRNIEFNDFEQEQQGFNFALGHLLSEDGTSRGSFRYSFSRREIKQNTGVNASAVIFREILQSNESSSQIGLSFDTDTRDDRFAPTSGMRYGANIEYAGLGGFANFLRMEGRFAWYLGAPKWLLPRSTFVFSARAGWAIPFNDISDWDFRGLDDVPGCDADGACENVGRLDQIDDDLTLPLSERYFLGGIGTFQLRGYEARSVGPRRAQLTRSGIAGTGSLFRPVGTEVQVNPADGTLVAVCNDTPDRAFNQGNGNGKCNNIDDNDIDDFDDLRETDVVGGNKFITTSFEYRFPVSEEVGLQGVLFVDGGNAFAENESMWDPQDWRYGWGGGVLWFSPFGPLQLVLGFPIDPLEDEKSPVFEFSVGGFGL